MTKIFTEIKHLSATALLLGIAVSTWTGKAHSKDTVPLANIGKMNVTKSPTCGCCGAWVSLARKEGFDVEVTDTANVAGAKLEGNVPGDMWACHTATIDGYVVEGHVPFGAIRRLLSERPDIEGIAVPGMPHGSPGMGNNPNARYDVFAFGGEAADGHVFYRAGE